MTDEADQPPDDHKVPIRATGRVDPTPSPPNAGDEDTGDEYFLFDEGHTARILNPDEVVKLFEGTYVPEGASKSRPRQADKVDSTPYAGDGGVTLESIEFVTEGGRVLTADEVMDIVEGRAEMPD